MGIDGAEITRGDIFFQLAPAEHKITEYRNRCAAKTCPTFFSVFYRDLGSNDLEAPRGTSSIFLPFAESENKGPNAWPTTSPADNVRKT